MKHKIEITATRLRKIDNAMANLGDLMGDLQMVHPKGITPSPEAFTRYAANAAVQWFRLQDLLHDHIFAQVIEREGDI